MGILTVDRLSHSFGEKELYKEASFELHKGEHMGVVGQNGSGKSTLIKILLEDIMPSGGRVVWQSGIQTGSIDQHADIDANLSIQEYLLSAFAPLYEAERKMQALYNQKSIGEKELSQAARLQEYLEKNDFYSVESQTARVASGLGLSAIGTDRAVGTLSGGQRAKAILAKLLLSRPDALLLDEPTNFLDAAHITWLSEYLSSFPGSFVIVSHDFDFLERVTTCVLDIEFQTIKKYNGKYSDFVRQKTQRRSDYIRQYEAQRKETERLEEYIAKNKARASTARMAQSRQKALDRMEKMAPPSVLPKPNIAFKGLPPPGQRAISAEGLIIGYGAPLLPELTFTVEDGQKVAITGFNGIGKSTLLKTLAGKIPALGGQYTFPSLARVGYFEQELLWSDARLTPLDILSAEHPDVPPKQLRRELARCGITAARTLRGIASLSGGEQNKVKLCRLTMNPYHILLLDEPTNHLDAETKEVLHQALLDYPGAVLIACHESSFLKGLANRVIDIEKILARAM